MNIPGFLGPTYPNRSGNYQPDRTINWYPELNPSPDAKTVLALVGVPGTKQFTVAGAGPIRGMYACNKCLYVVSGPSLYVMSSDNVVTGPVGTLATSSGSVGMKFNGLATSGVGGNQIGIVDGEHLYIFNVVTMAWSLVILAIKPASITYLDGYFIITAKDTMLAFSSNLYDGITWNALATAAISAAPDNLVGCCNQNQEVWFIKEYTTELWYDAGVATSSGFPFARVPGAVINCGTSAPGSVVSGSDAIYMVGNVRSDDAGHLIGVVALAGSSSTVISPVAINYQLSQMETVADAYGFMFSMEGHTFLVLTFPTANWTIIYDTTTQMWHERMTGGQDNSNNLIGGLAVNKWNASCYSMFNKKHCIGDTVNGNIYEMSSNFGTENGEPITCTRITANLFDREGLDNLFVHRLEVDIDAGEPLLADAAVVDYSAKVYINGSLTTINVIEVGTGKDYTTLATAIAAATANTLFVLYAGTYDEYFTCAGAYNYYIKAAEEGVTIKGVDVSSCTASIVEVEGVTCSDWMVKFKYTGLVPSFSGAFTARLCTVEDNVGSGVVDYDSTSSAVPNITIDHCNTGATNVTLLKGGTTVDYIITNTSFNKCYVPVVGALAFVNTTGTINQWDVVSD